ncbi:MAG TPA: ABC transporter permease [bacterium]|nr:ABC transporter permease [bacterium]
MGRYIVARVLLLIPVLIGVSIASFSLLHLIPGDPAVILGGSQATEADLAGIRKEFGLTDPLPVQYVRYVSQALHGKLGISIRTREPVADSLVDHLAFTLRLTMLSVFISMVVGVAAGVAAAMHHNSWLDSTLMVASLTGISMPGFWLGLLLLLIFAGTLRWLPAGGNSGWEALILPSVVLGTGGAAHIARMTRASMLEIIRQDYIRTLRANGIPEFLIIYKHALRNALNPVLTTVGLQFGYLLGGAVVVETIFSLPGMGQLLINAIFSRDYPIVQSGMLLLSVTFVSVNLLTDITYALVNPRIRY